jgi:ketopantoate reductase
MGRRIVFMGAGVVGGYVGGHSARTGEDVTLSDTRGPYRSGETR